jgi:hypothetical protein
MRSLLQGLWRWGSSCCTVLIYRGLARLYFGVGFGVVVTVYTGGDCVEDE